jgi:cytochrome c oxidase subunit II
MNPSVHSVDFAFTFIIGVSLVLLALIMIAMIYFLIKYNEKKNPTPTDIRSHTGLEIVWTVIPVIIASAMFYFGWQSYLGLRKVPDDAIKIDATAMMFDWEFKYPNGGLSDELYVPQGRAIHITLTADDVIHSFYLPSFRVKIDAVPGMKTYAWFIADALGEYDVFCAEYCGTGHADMTTKLTIVSQEEYEEYIADLEVEEEDEDEDEDEEDEESGETGES